MSVQCVSFVDKVWYVQIYFNSNHSIRINICEFIFILIIQNIFYLSCRSRKLNTQLEKAIQEAMAELDRIESSSNNARLTQPMTELSKIPQLVQFHTNDITAMSTPTSNPTISSDSFNFESISHKPTRRRLTRATAAAHQRKLIKIAPAPLNNNITVTNSIQQY